MKLMSLVFALLLSTVVSASDCTLGRTVENLTSTVDNSVPVVKAKKMIKKTMQLFSEDFGMSEARAQKYFQANHGEIAPIIHDEDIYYISVIYPGQNQVGQIYRASDLKIVAHVEDGEIVNCEI